MPDNSASRRALCRSEARDRNPRRSRRPARYRDPGSGWANRSRRTGYRCACPRRTVWPDRRYGSWRNRRRSVSALPRAIVSAEGGSGDRAAPAAECSAQKHDRENRPHGAMSFLHRSSPLAGSIARKRSPGAPSRFARRPGDDTNRNAAAAFSGTKLRFCASAASVAQICDARAAKIDIDWLLPTV